MVSSEKTSLSVIDGGVSDDNPTHYTASNVSFGGGGSSGGGPTVDAETKNYLDAKVDAVKAQNDARFAEVISKLDGMHPATWQQNAGVAVTATIVGIGMVFAVLAYASDRFDSGVGAMGAIEESLDTQRELNATQDQRLEHLLGIVEAQIVKPKTGSQGQD